MLVSILIPIEFILLAFGIYVSNPFGKFICYCLGALYIYGIPKRKGFPAKSTKACLISLALTIGFDVLAVLVIAG